MGFKAYDIELEHCFLTIVLNITGKIFLHVTLQLSDILLVHGSFNFFNAEIVYQSHEYIFFLPRMYR